MESEETTRLWTAYLDESPRFLYTLNVNAQAVSVSYAVALVLAISIALATLAALVVFAISGSFGQGQMATNNDTKNTDAVYSSDPSETYDKSDVNPTKLIESVESVADSVSDQRTLEVLKAIDEASEKFDSLDTGTEEKAFYMQLQACIRIAKDMSHTETESNSLLVECYDMLMEEYGPESSEPV